MGINIDYERVDQVAARLQNAKENIAPQITALRQEVNALLTDGMRLDATSPALASAHGQFSDGLLTAVNGIENFAKMFRDFVTGMKEMDANFAKDISSNSK